MLRVLFICTHNSARSQMAEAFLKQLSEGRFDVESAGISKNTLNPYMLKAMQEEGLDLSKNKSKTAFELLEKNCNFDVVITVCEKSAAERCPYFPAEMVRLAWGFPNPEYFEGSESEIMMQMRNVRDQIKHRIQAFVEVFQVPEN